MRLKKKGTAGKNGKFRTIYDPDRVIRTAQYRILTEILEHVPIPEYIYGFERNKSIPTMAKIHVGADVVVSIDLKDFFPSIKQFMVQAMFEKLGMATMPAKILSELTTYKSFVPQGSLTAPKISNIVAAGTFGKDVATYCKEKGYTLSIYADDITISYKDPKVAGTANRDKALEVVGFIRQTVRKYGFQINEDKTKIMRRHTRQWVCGAVVNEKVNMKRAERYQLRAIVHNCTNNGIEAEAEKAKMTTDAFIRKFAGRINWLCQLNPDKGVEYKVRFRKAAAPFMKKHPEIDIPELAWNSGVEIPYEFSAEDEAIFSSKPTPEEVAKAVVANMAVAPF